MSRSHVLQFSLALVLSLAAGILVFRWMNQAPTMVQPMGETAPEKVMIAVASQELQKGAKLKETDIRMTPYLPESLPAGHFTDGKDLAGRIVSGRLAAGEPITNARLIGDDVLYGGVSTMVAPGKRAIAVKGNKVLGLAGYIRPGNHVDVLVTMDDERRSKDKAVTKLVLENVRVLATGTELDQDGKDGSTSSVDVYTLEMTPKESETLALADTRGTLHFALRNPADEENIRTPGTNVPAVLGQLLAGGKKKSGRPAPARVYTKVEVITGAKRQTLRF